MMSWKIINKRERYGFTWQGWTIFLSVILFLLIILSQLVYPFLAFSNRINGDIMIVEGWLPDYALEKVVLDFNSGPYKFIATVGGPLAQGSYLAEEYNTEAELSAAALIKIGIDPNKLYAIPTPAVERDRVYASAIELKKWLDNSRIEIQALDIYSLGSHSRRSWLIYQHIFNPNIEVGVVAINNKDYDSNKWWNSTLGVKTIIIETISYIYTIYFLYF